MFETRKIFLNDQWKSRKIGTFFAPRIKSWHRPAHLVLAGELRAAFSLDLYSQKFVLPILRKAFSLTFKFGRLRFLLIFVEIILLAALRNAARASKGCSPGTLVVDRFMLSSVFF